MATLDKLLAPFNPLFVGKATGNQLTYPWVVQKPSGMVEAENLSSSQNQHTFIRFCNAGSIYIYQFNQVLLCRNFELYEAAQLKSRMQNMAKYAKVFVLTINN